MQEWKYRPGSAAGSSGCGGTQSKKCLLLLHSSCGSQGWCRACLYNYPGCVNLSGPHTTGVRAQLLSVVAGSSCALLQQGLPAASTNNIIQCANCWHHHQQQPQREMWQLQRVVLHYLAEGFRLCWAAAVLSWVWYAC